jgi:AcrR family transcriptional regulator
VVGRSRLGLSEDGILDGALRLLDRDGLDGFSMRRLADELGVGTMTLYGYFRGRDELLDALIDRASEELEGLVTRGSWRVRLRQLVLAMHAGLVAHPGLVELRLRRPLISPGALRLSEAAMSIMCDAGFSRREAARAYRSLFLYTFGAVAFAPPNRADSDRAATVEALQALSPAEYPTLGESATEVADSMADQEVFDFGLDRLLEGLDRLRRSRRPAA